MALLRNFVASRSRGRREGEQGSAAEISSQDCCLEIRVQVIRKKKVAEKERGRGRAAWREKLVGKTAAAALYTLFPLTMCLFFNVTSGLKIREGGGGGEGWLLHAKADLKAA